MTAAVVILNWNGRHFLEQYLPGVQLHSQLPGVSVVVADNASTDDSLSYLQQHHPDIQVVTLDKNYGFAEGYNRALQQIEADYYVLLNSDVAVTEQWLQPMFDLMQKQSNVAACMPKIKSASDHSYFEYAGAAGGLMDKYGYTFCRGRLFDTVEKDLGQYDTEMEICWATGACCMVRAPLFHQVGGFDKNFYAHMEEVDLCWRWRNEGYSIWYTPEATVYHVGGGTLPQSSPFKLYLNYRNNLLTMYKNLPQKHRKRTLFFRMVLDGISAVYALLKGNTVVLKAVWKAHVAFWKLRPEYHLIRSKALLHYPSGIYQRSIVFQYFVKKRKKYSDIEVNGWK